MIVTLTGGNAFALGDTLRQLVTNFTKEYSTTAVENMDGSQVTTAGLVATMQAGSLFSDKRMIIVENVATNKTLGEDFDKIVSADNADVTVVFVEPKFDKRSSLYKLLKKHTGFKEFNELDENSMARWATEYAKQQGANLSQTDARYLVQRVGIDQLRLSHEIDKLTSYSPKITHQTIDLLTEASPQGTTFNLLDAAFAKHAKQALKIYSEQRRAKVEPQAILGMLAWQLHIIAAVKAAGERNADEIASVAKISPFVVRKSLSIIRGITLAEIQRLVRRALDIDVQLKSVAIDADDALRQLLIEIAV